MDRRFEILIEPELVADAVLSLSQIDDIQIEVQTRGLSEPDAQREHPTYKLSPQDVATIVVSIAPVATSLVALATAILHLKTEKQKSQTPPQTQPSIKVNRTIVFVSDFDTPEKLAIYISKKLEMT